MLRLLLISLFIVINLTNPPSVIGWSIIKPATYQVAVENGLNNTLWVHCKSGDSDLGPHKLAKDANFSWVFKTSVLKKRLYFCGLTWNKHWRKTFDAFTDEQEFVDRGCGGRHCFWKALDDGIYLYNIYKAKFFKKFKWDKYI